MFLTTGHRGSLLGLYTLVSLARFLTYVPAMLWVTTAGTSEGLIENMALWSLAGSVLGPVIWGPINAIVYRTLRQVRESVDILSTPSVPDARIHASD